MLPSRNMFKLTLFILSLAVCALSHDMQEKIRQLKNKKVDFKSLPPMDDDMIRLLLIDYSFRTESIIYDDVANKKESTPSTVIAGNFSFETLHHDNDGGMLGRFQITQCDTGNCGITPPVYVSFRQGGNNVDGVFVDLKEAENYSPAWNFLYAIVNTIYTPAEYGEGDDQTVDTVYGRCNVQFGRPQDKRFRRKINNCQVGHNLNFSRFSGLEQVVYDQDVWYIQNTKVDADIVIVDAIELLSFRSPLSQNYGFQLESRTHVEIANRTRVFVKQHCVPELTAAECALKSFGATRVGNKLYEDVIVGSNKNGGKLLELVEQYRTHLHDMGETHLCDQHSRIFAQLAQTARFSNRDDWEKVLSNPENEHVLPVIANALGAAGDVPSLSTAREVLLRDAADLLDDFLLGVAHSSTADDKWRKQLIYWLNDVDDETEDYWKIANTVATVLRKKCEATVSSLNACNTGKDLMVNNFINKLTAKALTGEKLAQVLKVLYNLPVFGSYDLAKKQLCSSQTSVVQLEALKLIRQANQNLYESQLIQKLIKIFRNTCQNEASTTESQIAVDILLKCIPHHQQVATLLLRTETLLADDAEKWKYLYEAIAATNEKDELKAELWSKMRQFKVFRPNYLHRSLSADSFSHWQQIAEAAEFKIFSTTNAEFFKNSFRRSEFSISAKKGKKEENLFSLSAVANGLEQYIVEGAHQKSGDPEASVRLELLGHALPEINIFKGNSGMLSAVWNANGQTVKAFEGHIPLRDSVLSIPLLSGLTLDVTSSSSVSVRITAAAEVSLWNRDGGVLITADVSAYQGLSAVLSHHGESRRSVSSEISALTSIKSHTEALFTSIPFHFCGTSEVADVKMTSATVVEDIEKPRKKYKQTTSRTYPSFSLRLGGNSVAKCNEYTAARNIK